MNIKGTLKLSLGVPLLSNLPDLHDFNDNMFKIWIYNQSLKK